MNSRAYKTIYLASDHPFACMGRVFGKTCAISEHRFVMATHIGRPLKRKEIVHHRDNNPENNTIDNLELMTSGRHSIVTRRDAINKHIVNIRKSILVLEAELECIEEQLKL